jgi:hypothetical protein
MAEEKFFSFQGKFICKKCKQDVTEARFWRESGDATWMCANKHISKVNFNVRGY